MKNVAEVCIQPTKDLKIKFEENKRKIIFMNPDRKDYKRVQVDGCAIDDKVTMRCDKLLVSADEHEERYVELKGTDVMHAIDQLESTIVRLGEFDDNRHAYVISTNVAPAYTTKIQQKALHFKKKYHSELVVKEKLLEVALY